MNFSSTARVRASESELRNRPARASPIRQLYAFVWCPTCAAKVFRFWLGCRRSAGLSMNTRNIRRRVKRSRRNYEQRSSCSTNTRRS
eukprot:COSAG02_NODE_2320_length_9141_cov_5.148087_8_plen_87_part_00